MVAGRILCVCRGGRGGAGDEDVKRRVYNQSNTTHGAERSTAVDYATIQLRESEEAGIPTAGYNWNAPLE